MKISLESIFYSSINIVAGAVALYKYPYESLTAFAIGILIGTARSRYDLDKAFNGNNKNIYSWTQSKNDQLQEEGTNHIIDSIKPSLLTTMINCFALATLTRSFNFLDSSSRYHSCVGSIPAFFIGYKLAYLFALDKLIKSGDSKVKSIIKQSVI